MAIIPQMSLFSWEDIEDLADLKRLNLVIEHLPDEELMITLEKQRKNGRNDYPVRAIWNTILAGIVFEHKSIESLRRELCPAKQYGIICNGVTERQVKQGIRIPLDENRRLFTPIDRASYKWEREYNKRTAVERVNSRLDVSFGFENHTIRGLQKMKVKCGLALAVMLAMAIGHIKENRLDKIRSFTS